jgi:hypothetical protein
MPTSYWWKTIQDDVRGGLTVCLPVDASGSWVVLNQGPDVVYRVTPNGDEDGEIAVGQSATLTATTHLFSFRAQLRLWRGATKSRLKLGGEPPAPR